ncbi:MAG TPA: hypothetical protein VK983_03130 [Candidatus Limnocylindrales bacterium]|nr:hypothetical protein [Candidatus Limnocylindrales bacterium]
MQSLMILGRQPALGIAELESLYGATSVQPAGKQAVLLDVDPCLVAFDRLGGTMKFAKVLTTLDTIDWRDIEKFLIRVSPGHAETMPEGKMTLGLSAYDLRVTTGQLLATGLSLKKVIKKSGRPVRLVPNKELELNTAQVLHNNLTDEHGWELLLIKDGPRTIVAQTVRVQDIESYTLRDRERPKRDARVGMLPPKLAQTLINVAAGQLPESELSNICEVPAGTDLPAPVLNHTVLDPFCGTGVVLLEAALMGYQVYGTDLEPRMIEYSAANYSWLAEHFALRPEAPRIEVGDATNHQWQPPVDIIAGESYLGRPFTTLPDPQTLAETVSGCNLIIKKFLRNLAGQVKSDTRICMAVPAWQIRSGQFKHLPLLSTEGSGIDQIAELGYNRISFEHVRTEDLLYYREGQVVARELLVLTKQ